MHKGPSRKSRKVRIELTPEHALALSDGLNMATPYICFLLNNIQCNYKAAVFGDAARHVVERIETITSELREGGLL